MLYHLILTPLEEKYICEVKCDNIFNQAFSNKIYIYNPKCKTSIAKWT